MLRKAGAMKASAWLRRALVSASLALGVVPVFASGPADYELLMQKKSEGAVFDDRPWVELEAALPKAPLKENLVEIDAGPTSTNHYLVDESSVAYGGDGVIRYTMLVVSPSGVRNVSYEGMRCETGEHRMYAFGRTDGSWSQARRNAWVKIDAARNRHQAVLFRDYFCAAGGAVGDTESAKRVLRYGNPAAVAR